MRGLANIHCNGEPAAPNKFKCPPAYLDKNVPFFSVFCFRCWFFLGSALVPHCGASVPPGLLRRSASTTASLAGSGRASAGSHRPPAAARCALVPALRLSAVLPGSSRFAPIRPPFRGRIKGTFLLCRKGDITILAQHARKEPLRAFCGGLAWPQTKSLPFTLTCDKYISLVMVASRIFGSAFPKMGAPRWRFLAAYTLLSPSQVTFRPKSMIFLIGTQDASHFSLTI